jgi:hypothetical protein
MVFRASLEYGKYKIIKLRDIPLDPSLVYTISEYYHRDIGTYSSYLQRFDFIGDQDLRERLAQEFYVARYAAKLQEALAFDKNSFELLGHLKLQIIQYAGIYEAVISYLLLNKLATHPSVQKLGKRIEYKKVNALAGSTQIQHNGEEVFLCRQASLQEPWVYVRFEDKLKAAKEIGFLTDSIATTILETYKLLHSVHIEKAVRDEIEFEMEQCKQAYLVMQDFTNGIKTFLSSSLTVSSDTSEVAAQISGSLEQPNLAELPSLTEVTALSSV